VVGVAGGRRRPAAIAAGPGRVGRAEVDLDLDVLGVPLGVGGLAPVSPIRVGIVRVVTVVEGGALLDVGQDMEEQAAAAGQLPADARGVVAQAGRQTARVLVGAIDRRNGDLSQVAAALDPDGRL